MYIPYSIYMGNISLNCKGTTLQRTCARRSRSAGSAGCAERKGFGSSAGSESVAGERPWSAPFFWGFRIGEVDVFGCFLEGFWWMFLYVLMLFHGFSWIKRTDFGDFLIVFDDFRIAFSWCFMICEWFVDNFGWCLNLIRVDFSCFW